MSNAPTCSSCFWLHLGDRKRLLATPPTSKGEHGVFATRSPNRPNPIAIDIVQLLKASRETGSR
ncbi:MAG: TrmO family methyltransferase [Methanothrix soehngenii]